MPSNTSVDCHLSKFGQTNNGEILAVQNGNLGQISESSLEQLSWRVRESYTSRNCDDPKNECDEYKCIMYQAIRENDLSVCELIPEEVFITHLCPDEIDITG
ncbi:hypothetical protein GOV10_02185, partial [Candidatus Woesearchaeota archaeon]|nr:hypothetical protein [Candidatus Woesearchaeota archaeon]